MLDLPTPDVILTHWHGDVNTDHSAVYRSALVYARPYARRPKVLVACEALSSSEWGAQPFPANWWFELSEEALQAKVEALSCYERELRAIPHPRSAWGVRRKAEQRGMEAGYQYAEAFHIIKLYGE